MIDLTISYIDLDEANDYFTNRLNSDVWNNLNNDNNKRIALYQASRLIDNLNFIGEKVESTQPLEFPRTGDDIVPDQIKEATCEIAILLLDDIDMNKEINNLYVSSRSFVTSKTTYDRKYIPEYIAAGIPSATAWIKLKPYLENVNRNVTLERIS